MKRFEFRLDPVLRLKELQLESEQAKLEQLLRKQRGLTRDVEAITRERWQAKTAVYSLTHLENAELRTMSAFLLGLDARATTLRAQLAEIARAVEEQRQSVIKAERKVRLLEKLRGSKLEKWKRETSREIETVAQECWLSVRHVRRASGAVLGRPPSVAPPCPNRHEGPSTSKATSGISDSATRSR